MLTIGYGFKARHQHDNPVKGVSFSIKYAQELGLDWKQTLTALVEQANIKNFRLMSYWDAVEPNNDEYDYASLDWQIELIQKNGGTVSLALGQRQPRWPECHTPEWSNNLETMAYENNLVEYLETTTKRYASNPVVMSFQLENEAANRHFGECPPLDSDLLQRELEAVKTLTTKPVIINASNQSGTPLLGPIGDKVGYTIYKKAGFHAFDRWISWNYGYIPSVWHSFRAALTEGVHGTEVFVHELQAEPWGPTATVHLSDEEQGQSMDPGQLKSIVKFAENTGMSTIYLWGGEWWYWRLTEFNDTMLWQTVKDVYSSPDNQ